ncbi:hypothetical protein [Luteolibacter sp. AS25]|uniref:hypothetical protein n=1 Tax=Luteolibacter sp. AS25 TaxID=3135776 RepID=UPI00398BB018
MAEQLNDREQYSLDEMMDKLKSQDNPGDQGELVTRSDGSKAYKVRKRKRRTDQTTSKNDSKKQKVQILQVSLLVGSIAIMGVIAGTGILYANSAAFRGGLVEKADSASGGKTSMSQFRMNPVTANAVAVEIDWPKGNPLSNLKLRTITAKISPGSFLGKVFKGEEITAATGELLVSSPLEGEDIRFGEKGDAKKLFQFHRYSVPSLKVFFGDEASNENVLTDTEASFYPGGVKGMGEIRLQKGILKIEGWPDLQLDRSFINVSGSDLDIKSLRFGIPVADNKRVVDRGFIEFSGVIQPATAGVTHVLSVNAEEFEMSELVGSDLGPFFSGKVNTKGLPDMNYLSVSPGSGEAATLQVVATNSLDSQIDLGGFPFLSQLAFVLDEAWYKEPFFMDDVTAVLKRAGDSVELTKINFIQRGRMALRGDIRNGAAGKIVGTLQVGIPEPMIATSPNPRVDIMFGKVSEGYRWIELKIGGTGAVPSDSFQELYDAAGVPASDGVGNEISTDSFESLIETD